MDNDPETTTSCKGEEEEERQNRRQFFNGLGKWSLAIVAAVAALRHGIPGPDMSGVVTGATGTDAEGFRERRRPLPRLAKKKHDQYGHSDRGTGHIDSATGYNDAHQDHNEHTYGPPKPMPKLEPSEASPTRSR